MTAEETQGGEGSTVEGQHSDEFTEGDRVEHTGEGVRGTVTCTAYPAPKFKVEWDDGYSTLESFHSVKKSNMFDRQTPEEPKDSVGEADE